MVERLQEARTAGAFPPRSRRWSDSPVENPATRRRNEWSDSRRPLDDTLRSHRRGCLQASDSMDREDAASDEEPVEGVRRKLKGEEIMTGWIFDHFRQCRERQECDCSGAEIPSPTRRHEAQRQARREQENKLRQPDVLYRTAKERE